MPSLRATFDAAKHFGLTDEEAWATVEEILDEHEQLVAALAARILAKQRASCSSRTADTAKAARTG